MYPSKSDFEYTATRKQPKQKETSQFLHLPVAWFTVAVKVVDEVSAVGRISSTRIWEAFINVYVTVLSCVTRKTAAVVIIYLVCAVS